LKNCNLIQRKELRKIDWTKIYQKIIFPPLKPRIDQYRFYIRNLRKISIKYLEKLCTWFQDQLKRNLQRKRNRSKITKLYMEIFKTNWKENKKRRRREQTLFIRTCLKIIFLSLWKNLASSIKRMSMIWT
jgi:dolichol kinase